MISIPLRALADAQDELADLTDALSCLGPLLALVAEAEDATGTTVEGDDASTADRIDRLAQSLAPDPIERYLSESAKAFFRDQGDEAARLDLCAAPQSIVTLVQCRLYRLEALFRLLRSTHVKTRSDERE